MGFAVGAQVAALATVMVVPRVVLVELVFNFLQRLEIQDLV